MSGYISLPGNRIHKKKEIRKSNLPSNFTESFYKDFLYGTDFSQNISFQQQLVNDPLSKDEKKFFVSNQQFW